MKTLGFLLLLAVGLGAAYWTVQRPGDGLDALRDDGRSIVARLSGAVDTLRADAGSGTVDRDGNDGAGEPLPPAGSATEVLSGRIDALENGLTRTMSMAESSVVQDRLDALDARMATLDPADPERPERPGQPDPATLAATERLAGLAERMDTAMLLFDERMDEQERARLALADRDAGQRSSLEERLDTIDARLDTLASGSRRPDGDTNGAERAADVTGATDASANGTPRDRGIGAALDARLVALEDALSGSRSASSGVAGLQARIGAIDERLIDLADSDSRIERTLTRLEEALDTADGDGRERSGNGAQRRAGAAPSRPDAAARDPAPVTRSDPALVSSIDAVRQQVDQLSASGFVTQDELRAQTEGKHVEYKIYFDNNATTVSDESARVLDSFIARETNRTTGVAIFGFTDRQGSATYNQQLAQRRAANVRSYLVQNGFDYTRIGNVAGLGEDAAAVLLEDDQEDARQRVVVLFASQP